jgi:hypothetical protein
VHTVGAKIIQPHKSKNRVDVSLNAFENKVQGWSFHVHGILSRSLSEAEKKRLKEAFPANKARGHLQICPG